MTDTETLGTTVLVLFILLIPFWGRILSGLYDFISGFRPKKKDKK